MSYEQFFARDLGLFSPEEHERIRNARVAIIGTGGIGGTLAVVLARSGVGRFLLREHDVYEPSNMNRQIACCGKNLGRNKALCVREQMLTINPEAEVEVVPRRLTADDLHEMAGWGDVIAPVMDEWPLSLTALEVVRQTKPAIMAYPVGTLGRVCTFTADSPTVAECLAMPYGYGYEKLAEYSARPEARKLLQYYRVEGGWTQEWFDEWVEGRRPHAQTCTIVWISACLAALEIIKLVSGRWTPIVAPRYWHITPSGARIARFGLGRRLISRLSRREWAQRVFPRLTGSTRLLRFFTRLLG